MRGKPFLGILFQCCRAYARLYRNEQATAYEGCCPKCGAPVRIQIGPEGTSRRFFVAHPVERPRH